MLTCEKVVVGTKIEKLIFNPFSWQKTTLPN